MDGVYHLACYRDIEDGFIFSSASTVVCAIYCNLRFTTRWDFDEKEQKINLL